MPEAKRKDRFTVNNPLKSLFILLLGFYLGGLHSTLFVAHPHHPADTTSSSNTALVGGNSALRPKEATVVELGTSSRHLSSSSQTERQLESQLQSLQHDLRTCHDEQQQTLQEKLELQNIAAAAADTKDGSANTEYSLLQDNHETTPRRPVNPLCRRFSYLQRQAALSLWLDHLPRIHAASQLLPNDPRWQFHDFTAQLLQIVSPRLPRSILNLPRDWSVVDRILTKVDARIQYLQQQQKDGTSATPPPPPPIKIIVLGGSILIGRNCRKLVTDLGLQMRMPNRECTYSNRLQKFLDAFAGMPNLFQITKIAMGGTNTAVGSQIFHFDLVPEEAHNADIIINGYATNDMHVLSVLEAQSNNKTLGEYVFNMTQEFVRNVLQDNPCREKPLLIHLDDYLGNEQRQIMSTMELSQAVQSLADYYGFNRISYANIIRDIVYGDTKEHWFSPEGWWPKGATGMEREIHPGMGMHIVSAWMVAYDFLSMATTFCSMEHVLESTTIPTDYDSTKFASIVPLTKGAYKGKYTNIPGKPLNPPKSLPPPLTPSLNLEFLSDSWRSDEASSASRVCNANAPRKRCIFSWISGLSQMQKNMTYIDLMFQSHATTSRGWKLVDESDKVGYIPSKVGDKVVLEFTDLAQPIQSVNFFVMKSYGEKWAGSRVSATVARKGKGTDWVTLASFEMSGVHAKNTSEIYPQTISLPDPVPVDSSLQVSYELVGGTTFKLMGLAVCS